MTTFAVLFFIIVLLIVGYALKGRQWLKSKPWAQPFFDFVEPIELLLFKKSETILMGRLLWVGGLFVTAYDTLAVFASSLDLTPITTRIFDALHVANDFRGLVTTAIIGALGLVINWLRAKVSKPLDLVAVKESTATAEVKVAIAAADEAKDQAVATVKAAAS